MKTFFILICVLIISGNNISAQKNNTLPFIEKSKVSIDELKGFRTRYPGNNYHINKPNNTDSIFINPKFEHNTQVRHPIIQKDSLFHNIVRFDRPKGKTKFDNPPGVIKLGLDSIVAENSGKMEYAYDEYGNMILKIHSIWSSELNNWQKIEKYEFAYDESGNQTLDSHYYWNNDINGWAGEYKYENTYDEHDNLTSQLYCWWYENEWLCDSKLEIEYNSNDSLIFYKGYCLINGDWTLSSLAEQIYNTEGYKTSKTTAYFDFEANVMVFDLKEEYQYDENNNLILEDCSVWNTNTNDWLYQYKTEYNYDTDGNMFLYIHSVWDNETNDWRQNGKGEFTYTEEGYVAIKALYYRDTNDDVWIGSNKYEYEYTVSGNICMEIHYYWPNNEWIPLYKWDVTYNENDDMTLVIRYDWDQISESWVNASKNILDYNTGGFMLLWMTFNWDNNLNEWIGSQKFEWVYDANNNMIQSLEAYWDESWIYLNRIENIIDLSYSIDQLIVPEWYLYYFFNKCDQSNYYYFENSNWVLQSSELFYYSEHEVIGGIEKSSWNEILSVYPNPAHDYISFKFPDSFYNPAMDVYDINGRKVLSKSVKNNEKIDVGILTPGFYLITIRSQNVLVSYKLIIE
jgi:hypothetical protein